MVITAIIKLGSKLDMELKSKELSFWIDSEGNCFTLNESNAFLCTDIKNFRILTLNEDIEVHIMGNIDTKNLD